MLPVNLDHFALEWMAFGVGTLGTVLWALRKAEMVVGLLWLTSGLLWIVFATSGGHSGLAARDLLGVVLYAVGVLNTWKARKKARHSPTASVTGTAT